MSDLKSPGVIFSACRVAVNAAIEQLSLFSGISKRWLLSIALALLLFAVAVWILPSLRHWLYDIPDLLLVLPAGVLALYTLFSEKVPRWVKSALVLVLLAQSLLSVIKAVQDNKDKELMQDLAAATLALPNDRTKTLKDEIGKAFGAKFIVGKCFQWSIGIACELKNKELKTQVRFLVMGRYDAAKIYGKFTRGKEWEGTAMLKDLADKKVEYDEAFMDRLGVFGFLLYVENCIKAPAYYTYRLGEGVYLVSGTDELITLLEEKDLKEAGEASAVFNTLKDKMVPRIKGAPGCSKQASAPS